LEYYKDDKEVKNHCDKIKSIPYFIGLPAPNPRILIPLVSPLVQANSFALYNPSSIQGNIFKWLGKTAALSGIMNILGRFFAAPVETFKATDTIQPLLNDKVLAHIESAWRKALGINDICFALSFGDPNDYRKITALIFDKNEKPVAFGKMGCTPQAKSLIKNERHALELMNAADMQSATIPKMLDSGGTDSSFWLLQSPLMHGHTSPNNLCDEHFNFLCGLARNTTHAIPLSSSALYEYFQRTLKEPSLGIKKEFESERHFIEILRNQVLALTSEKLEKQWLFTATHGDFAPWNMRLAQGQLALFDWEYYLSSAPAGWDIFYFIFRVDNLINRLSLQAIFTKFEKGAYSDNITHFEKKAGITIPDHRLLASLVILAIAFDLVPRWICHTNQS